MLDGLREKLVKKQKLQVKLKGSRWRHKKEVSPADETLDAFNSMVKQSVGLISTSIAVLVVPQLRLLGRAMLPDRPSGALLTSHNRKHSLDFNLDFIEGSLFSLDASSKSAGYLRELLSKTEAERGELDKKLESVKKLAKILGGLETLYSKLQKEWQKLLIKAIRGVITNVTLAETKRFGRPAKLLFERFDKFEKLLNEQFIGEDGSKAALGLKWRREGKCDGACLPCTMPGTMRVCASRMYPQRRFAAVTCALYSHTVHQSCSPQVRSRRTDERFSRRMRPRCSSGG
eukprot:5233831-Prymnesium_polylepis.2